MEPRVGEYRKPSFVTPEMIYDAKHCYYRREAICAQIGANLCDRNDKEQYAYNNNGVYLIDATGIIVLLFSWTIMGTFVQCVPALNVTDYVDVSKLLFVRGAA